MNFESVADAARAYDALNNVVVPLLTGTKQLKMRFKPAKVSLCLSFWGRTRAYARPVCLLGSAGRRIGQPLSNSI